MCNCTFFCRFLCTIILVFAFIFNSVGNLIGVGDIIPTEKCPICDCGTTAPPETSENESTDVSSTDFSSTDAVSNTMHTDNSATETTTTATTTTTTTTTTTPTTTTTTTTTTEEGPYMTAANALVLTTFGGSNNDIIRGIDALEGSGYVVCGTTNSVDGIFADLFEDDWVGPFAFVAKLNKTAQIEWLVTLGSNSGGITLEDIAALSDGNIVAVGSSKAREYSTTPDEIDLNRSTEAIAVTLSVKDGKVISQQTFGGSGTDFFNCVSATSTGYVMGGKTNSSDGFFEGLPSSSAVVINCDFDGNVYWKRYLSGSKGGSVADIDVDDDNNIFFTCLTSSRNGDFAAFEELMGGYTDTLVIKYDYKGDFVWDYVIASSCRDEFSAITHDGKGGCVVAGQYENIKELAVLDGTLAGVHNCGGRDALMFRIDRNGDLMWRRSICGLYDDFITDIAKTNGGFIVTGYTESYNRDFASIGNKGGYDAFAAFIDKSGKIIKIDSHSGAKDDVACVVAVGEKGEALVAGKTQSSNGAFDGKTVYGDYDVFAVRYRTSAS